MSAAESEKEKNRVIKEVRWMDGSGCLAFSRTFPTCLKTGPLIENTNLCPGWRRSDPFVADLVIMFPVPPIQSVFSEQEECRACTMHSVLQGLQMYHTPMFGRE